MPVVKSNQRKPFARIRGRDHRKRAAPSRQRSTHLLQAPALARATGSSIVEQRLERLPRTSGSDIAQRGRRRHPRRAAHRRARPACAPAALRSRARAAARAASMSPATPAARPRRTCRARAESSSRVLTDDAEELLRDVGQLMRFVDDHRVRAGQKLAEAATP